MRWNGAQRQVVSKAGRPPILSANGLAAKAVIALARTARRRAILARLRHRPDRDRLCFPALCDRQRRRPQGGEERRRQAAALYLCAEPRHLLHLVDLLRLGRARLRARAGIPGYLYRPALRVPVLLSVAAAHHPAGQGGEDHLDRRLPRRALRQELSRRAHRDADRHGRRGPVYRAAAQGDLRLGQPDGRALLRLAAQLQSVRQRHLAGGGGAACRVCRAVRDAPCRRHRTSGWAGAGGCGGIGRETGRLPGGRRSCDVLPVRQPRRLHQRGHRRRRGCKRRCNIGHRSAHGWC